MHTSAQRGALQGRPVILGEVLFDTFPDGSAVLGGAPFNVAWHLQGFGLAPLLISRVGADAWGKQVRQAMTHWGMDLSGLQQDPDHATGVVQVAIDDGEPRFHILPERAYDFIASDLARAAVEAIQPALLYHGSLIARHEDSRQTLMQLVERFQLPAFVDINMRPPWWQHAHVNDLLAHARQLKLNEHELAEILTQSVSTAELEPAAEALRQEYGLEMAIITRGAEGAMAVSAAGTVTAAPASVDPFVDSVGAGDAFSAVAILGLLEGWDIATVMGRAAEFAAAICGVRGATTDDTAIYRKHLYSWRS